MSIRKIAVARVAFGGGAPPVEVGGVLTTPKGTTFPGEANATSDHGPSIVVGHERFVGGQRYRCVAIQPHIRRDGQPTELAIWESECAKCGEPFSIVTSARHGRFEPNRRCTRHRRPGSRVKPGAEVVRAEVSA